jgi:hypothetical protein
MYKNYRIYFRNDHGWIEACEDFRAESDQSAMIIGSWLFGACSDYCAEYDVWCGRQRIAGAPQPTRTRTLLTKNMRASLRKTAQALLSSRWKIAQSQHLLEFVGQLKRAGEQIEFDPWAQSKAVNGMTLQTRDAACSE